MLLRPDLLDRRSPPGLEIFQMTTEIAVPSSHVYMEAQVFTPDSRHVVLHRSAHPHGSDKNDPEHRYLLCDTETGEMQPLTDEVGATAPSLTADGQFLYYFVNETEFNSGRLSLKRRAVAGGRAETIMVIDSPLPGTSFRPSRPYPLSTLSSDSRRIAISAFFGNGKTSGPWGLMVFDLTTASVNVVLCGPSWINMHPQYSRSLDPLRCHDIMVQENHGCRCDEAGNVLVGVSGTGCDIHVIRDDGHDFRNLPWGRDDSEACQGHQCWRGRSEWAITGTGTPLGGQELVESGAVPHSDHVGLHSEGGVRNILSRGRETPGFCHFATDIAGQLLITDNGAQDQGHLEMARLGVPGQDALIYPAYLCTPNARYSKGVHTHPFLSPDGNTAFFNSDETGICQAYMMRGLPLQP